MPQTYEPAPLDAPAQRMTQGVIFVGGTLTLPGLFLALSGLLRYDAAYYGAIACCVLAAIVLGYVAWMWAGHVREFVLTDTHLVIKRQLRRRQNIPLTQITAIYAAPLAIDAPPVGWGSNVGIFGYQGTFVTPRYGRVMGMASNRELMVIMNRDNTLLLLSPANPSRFVDDVRAAMTAHADETKKP